MVPKFVETVIKKLKENNFQAYIVGGAVRDILMGEKPADFDITTSASPDDVIRLFERTVPTGIKHGTVTVLSEGKSIEVTTFRSELGYSDNRHPDKVSFGVSVETDVLRRDFTVNALLMGENGEVLDLVGGISDIENKIIRTVGEADKRFSEDALRMLRALRFSSVLGFRIEEETTESINENAGLLKNISAERILKELLLLLCGKDAERVLNDYFSVFEEILDGIKKENISGVSRVPPVFEYRLYYLLGGGAVDALKKLKCKNEIIKRVKLLSENEGVLWTREKIIEFASRGRERDTDFVLKYYSEKTGKIQIYDLWNEIKSEIIYEKDLVLSGEDIKEVGFKGKEIGEIKDNLLLAVNLKMVENTPEALREYIKKTDR